MNPVQSPSQDAAGAVSPRHIPEWVLLGVIALGGIGSLGLTVTMGVALFKVIRLVAQTLT